VLQATRRILDQDDHLITEDARTFLREAYSQQLRDEEACRELAFRQIEKAPGRCGLGLDLVANELFYAPDPIVRHNQLARMALAIQRTPRSCQARMAMNTTFLKNTSPSLATSTWDVIEHTEYLSDSNRTAWLAYGSLTEIAWSSGDTRLAQ
jgi:hypothetical protein